MISSHRQELAAPGTPRFSTESVARFVATMPGPYRLEYDDDEIREHSEIVKRRGSAIVHLEPMANSSRAGKWLCVVTDDRPGLLSLLSAAISAHSLDILTAKVYCRLHRDLPAEAVDFFAIRSVKPELEIELDHALLTPLRDSIEALLSGEIEVASLQKRATPTARLPRPSPSTAYFDETADADILIVQAADHPGLLLRITLTLFREGLTVQRSNVATLGQLARDEFELSEIDGSPLSDARKQGIIRGVMATLARRGQ